MKKRITALLIGGIITVVSMTSVFAAPPPRISATVSPTATTSATSTIAPVATTNSATKSGTIFGYQASSTVSSSFQEITKEKVSSMSGSYSSVEVTPSNCKQGPIVGMEFGSFNYESKEYEHSVISSYTSTQEVAMIYITYKDGQGRLINYGEKGFKGDKFSKIVDEKLFTGNKGKVTKINENKYGTMIEKIKFYFRKPVVSASASASVSPSATVAPTATTVVSATVAPTATAVVSSTTTTTLPSTGGIPASVILALLFVITAGGYAGMKLTKSKG